MEKGSKGVWIPADVWEGTHLSWLEKMILVEIDRCDTGAGCSKNDEYFAKFFNSKTLDVSNAIAVLNYLDRIEIKYDEGTRYLKVLKEDGGCK